MSPIFKGILGALTFFGLILGYVLEAKFLSGYLNLAHFLKTSLLLGAILGGLMAYPLSRKGKDQDSRFSIFAGLLVLGVIIGPLSLSWINRATSSPPLALQFELISIMPTMKTNIGVIKGQPFQIDAHKIVVERDLQRFELEIGPDLDAYLMDDKFIMLNIFNGGLGYRFISPSNELVKEAKLS